MSDHIHIVLSIPPKYAVVVNLVNSVITVLKVIEVDCIWFP